MRFLIAGSSGFLGTRLREQLRGRGHEVTALVRRPPGAGEVRWDPYTARLGPAVVDNHDVVVNLAGSPTLGNPHSQKWARAPDGEPGDHDPGAGRGDRRERDQADLPGRQRHQLLRRPRRASRSTEAAETRGDALLTRVSRAWQAATEPAVEAGARVCVLRTAPVFDRRSEPLKALRLLFKAGLGGPIGDGEQHMPMISARDWVDAVIHLAETDGLAGPFNLCCADSPTNGEFTRELARQVHRPAFVRVPGFVLRSAAGDLGDLVLDSVNGSPAALLASGFSFADPDVSAVLREGLDPSR